jgi:hypothetical protein
MRSSVERRLVHLLFSSPSGGGRQHGPRHFYVWGLPMKRWEWIILPLAICWLMARVTVTVTWQSLDRREEAGEFEGSVAGFDIGREED